MAHTFFCPNCGKRFDREESVAGKRARCKDCQHVFVIPAVAGQRLAPAARSQPRPSPARSATPTPSRPADDPYGLDESRSLPPARNPYAEPDEGSVALQPIRPGTPVKRKPRRRGGNAFAWLGPVTAGGIALELILLPILGYLTYAESPASATVVFEILRAVFIGMNVLIAVVTLILPFFESARQGLLCLFVPFYSLYYLITRWTAMKRPFFCSLCVNALPLAAALLLPAISAYRQAVLRAEQKQQAPVAEVAVRAAPAQRAAPAPPRPGRLPAPVGGISLVLSLSGFVDPQAAQVIGQKVGQRIGQIALELSPGHPQLRFSRQGNQVTFLITPLRDPQAFADKINFGTVTSVEGRTISVSVTPESAAQLSNAAPSPPPPDPGNAPAPRPAGPRRFPRRGPIGGPRSR